jgi:hypothetical protein
MAIITQYKGRTTKDSGAYYAPYTPNMRPQVNKKWEKIGMDMPTDKWVYNIRVQEIRDWIESYPIHMWKLYDIPNELINDVPIQAYLGQNYIFTEEMEAWFQLRWS